MPSPFLLFDFVNISTIAVRVFRFLSDDHNKRIDCDHRSIMRVPKELEEVLSITNPYWLEFISNCKGIHDLREIRLLGKNSTLSELDIGKAECCIVGEFHDGRSSYWDECAECHRLSLEFSAVIRPRSKLGKASFIEKLSEFVQHIQLAHTKTLQEKMACKLCGISDTPRYAVSA